MIDVSAVLRQVPHFERFCSVAELWAIAESLSAIRGFQVRAIGSSDAGHPIHHIRVGKGSIKALVVGYVHANEPIGGLTVFSLLTLLSRGISELRDANVQWDVIPCIDPDGALLNEGWSQRPFTFDRYMKHWYRQEPSDQPERSFPIRYKRLVFDNPTREASILRDLITELRPDFYFSLHNLWTGGAYFGLTRDIASDYYRQLHSLLEDFRIPLHFNYEPFGSGALFAPGVGEIFKARRFYDYLEGLMPEPEMGLHDAGAFPSDYLEEVNTSALMFIAELPYVRLPSDGSQRIASQSRRHLSFARTLTISFSRSRCLRSGIGSSRISTKRTLTIARSSRAWFPYAIDSLKGCPRGETSPRTCYSIRPMAPL